MNEEFFRVLWQQRSCEAEQCNERPGKWSCDQCWPEKGLEKNRMENGLTDRWTDGHCDSMTDPPSGPTQCKQKQDAILLVLIFKTIGLSPELSSALHTLSELRGFSLSVTREGRGKRRKERKIFCRMLDLGVRIQHINCKHTLQGLYSV